MIERLLLEADLEDQLPKLEVYGKTIDGIKELLRYLLGDPSAGKDTLHCCNKIDYTALCSF